MQFSISGTALHCFKFYPLGVYSPGPGVYRDLCSGWVNYQQNISGILGDLHDDPDSLIISSTGPLTIKNDEVMKRITFD